MDGKGAALGDDICGSVGADGAQEAGLLGHVSGRFHIFRGYWVEVERERNDGSRHAVEMATSLVDVALFDGW